jgi:hypothetical protein
VKTISIRTKHELAKQERRAATARVERRAGGCALRAGVETAALEVARIRHRDACREEARGEARRTMPRALDVFGEPVGLSDVGGWA